MNKSPEAFRTISEVAEALDVPPHVLRFWETRFAQVKPVKRGGGRRYYRPEDVRLLRGIRGLLYDDGMTIKGVQKILRERGIRHVIGLGTPAGEAERRAGRRGGAAASAATAPAAAPGAQPDLFDAARRGHGRAAHGPAPDRDGAEALVAAAPRAATAMDDVARARGPRRQAARPERRSRRSLAELAGAARRS